MQWTPETAAQLSRPGCRDCRETGLVSTNLCDCVSRAVFRACYRRFKHCGTMHVSMRKVNFERTSKGVDRTLSWVRRNEDYRADFHSCGLRALPRHLYQLFSFYHLHGCSLDVARRRLGMSYRQSVEWIGEVETFVGREIAFLEPYSLFPPQGYMIPAGRSKIISNSGPGGLTNDQLERAS
jgi:hypothetical protein